MDNSDDDIFDFDSPDFIEVENEKEKIISNEHHFNLITEISNNFYTTLEKNDIFEHKETWVKSSILEPIKFKIFTEETFPGIIDISLIKNSFISKVLIALCADIYEIKNTLNNIEIFPYESLSILSLYGEKIEDDSNENRNIFPGEGEKKISLLLPYLNQIQDNIVKLLSIVINLTNQLLEIYNEKKDTFKGLKYIDLYTPFEYISMVFSYFLAIDTIISQNVTISDDWKKYKMLIYNTKKNPSQYNINQEQITKLERLIKKINGPIFEKKCFELCIKNFIKNVGNFTPSGSGVDPIQNNKIFFEHFSTFLKNKTINIYNKLKEDEYFDERMEIFKIISLFVLYYRIYSENNNKKFNSEIELRFNDIWKFLKKIHYIKIVGDTNFEIDKYLSDNFSSRYKLNKIEPKLQDINKKKEKLLNENSKLLNDIIKRTKNEVVKWINQIESILYSDLESNIIDSNLPDEKIKKVYKIEYNVIKNGLLLSTYIKKKIKYILESHVILEKGLSRELIKDITTGLELIKVIQTEFDRLIPIIAKRLIIQNRILLSNIQNIIKPKIDMIKSKLNNTKKNEYYTFMKDISRIFNYNCQATPSNLRRIVLKLCNEMMIHNETKVLDLKEYEEINQYLKELDILNELSNEIKYACDTSFLYFFPSIIDISLEYIYNNFPKRIIFFAMAINDMDKPLNYIKFLDNNEMILKQRKIIKNNFEQKFLNKISRDIEVDLRSQIHAIFIKGLNTPIPSNKNYGIYLTIERFLLFDIIIDVKRYVEEYFNITFYKMTTLNINEWKTYQQMRNLAKSKYNLRLHEILLPSQSLEKGQDILDIIRNFVPFVKKYNHNMNNQIFIEYPKDSVNINYLGINQILNSIYTHGPGIVNSIINKSFQFISKLIQKLIGVISDDYINSVLKEEKDFWDENKGKINYNYPLEKAEQTRLKIKSVSEDYKIGFIEQLVKVITQIGNGIALSRMIRSALMEYNSQNVNLITSPNIDNFKFLTNQIELNLNSNDPTNNNNNINNFSQNMLNNTQNCFNEANKSFCEIVNNLKENGDNNNINYLSILVNAFGDALTKEKINDIELFAFLFPAITITFIEKLIVSKDNLLKKNEQDDTFFSDDGFIIGICYLLKVFRINELFESLNWFPSIIQYYKNQQINYESKKKEKKKISSDMDIEFNISERKISTYLKQFEILYYSYTAASVLFNE